MFFPENIMKDILEIIENTNLYSFQKSCKNINTDVEELKGLIGMNISMDIIKIFLLYDYWSNSFWILLVPDVMPSNKFLELLK